MAGLIEELSRRAAHAGVALAIYDGDDKIISVNRKHKELYPFVDFSSPIDFRHHFMECVKHKKFDESSVYKAPERWISFASRFRRLNRFSQTLTRHSDGRIIQVTFERIDGTNGRWYQMRRDVTAEVLQHIRMGENPLECINTENSAISPMQATFMVRILDSFPYPAALLTPQRQVIDGNLGFSKILSREDGLIVSSGRLSTRPTLEYDSDFAKRVAAFTRRRKREPITWLVPRSNETSSYIVTLSEPPTSLLQWESPATGMLLLTVTDPDTLPAIAPRIIADLLRISEHEAQLVLAYSTGNRTGVIATEFRVDQKDIASKVSSILAKTGFLDLAALTRQVTALSYVFGPRM